MKLWRIPNPWDYHQIGAVYVAAETAEAAVSRAQDELAREGRHDRDGEYSRGSAESPQWDAIQEVAGGAFFAEGCDD